MLFEYEDYRSYLRGRLVEGVRKNPAFSLRAMARQLEMSPSALSEVMRGKKNLSLESAEKIANKLRLDSQESEYFSLLVQLSTAKAPAVKSVLHERVRRIHPTFQMVDLDVESFKVISDWIHFAILVATKLSTSHVNADFLAKRLGLRIEEVSDAIERLKKVGLLEEVPGGHLRKASGNIRVSSLNQNEALRTFHKQMLEKASDSIVTQSNEEKVIGSETVAIDSSQLKDYNKLAEDFFDKVVALAEQSPLKDEVYYLGVQFFRITKRLEE